MFAGAGSLATAAASAIAEILAARTRSGTAAIALAGGRTPRPLYRCLALDHERDVPWDRVRVYWGDERHVPPDDDLSNYRMAREALLDHVPVRPDRVHRIPAGSGTPEQAALEYERTLRSHFDAVWPRFDLVLLGVGEDGHIASLFPGSPALDEDRRWVVPATAPAEPRDRITLTLPVLAGARMIFVLATGGSKGSALRGALGGVPDRRCPASLLRTTDAQVVWWADAAAAGQLRTRSAS